MKIVRNIFRILDNLVLMKDSHPILMRVSTSKYLNDATISTLSFSKETYGCLGETAL